MSEALVQQADEHILKLTINRPEQRNALTAELLAELEAALEAARRAADIRALILTGTANSFCAGMDLAAAEQAAIDEEALTRTIDPLYRVLECLVHFPKPVIAAVNGFAVAGGAALMTACDIVIAADQVRVGYPEINRGLVAAIVMPYLTRQASEPLARYLLLTGTLISATEAQRLGLIHEVVKNADLLFRAMHVARQLAQLPPELLSLTKQWSQQATAIPPEGLPLFCRQLKHFPVRES